ncbi:unnamed protein product [Clonostachys rosea f. rosea IK726]|uniref:FAS1 domain-containing protein n=2 Tax=Bionectria ochroleuca TaxID=29856 RepID=A0A0B7JX29_BIOOC|nr:unnamed protein product [Clonostachys rosea f. rosea IK726]
MKSAAICLLAASSSLAAVLPGPPVQVPLGGGLNPTSHSHHGSHSAEDDAQQSFIDSWLETLQPVKDSITSVIDTATDELASATSTLNGFKDDMFRKLQDASDQANREFPDLTIYQLIQLSNHTKKFVKALDKFPDVVKILNGTEANHTLFVPIDEAFEHLPHHEPPSNEFIEAALKYHIGVGNYAVPRLLSTNTLPTAYNEKGLGGEPQRLRTRVSLAGVTVNFYSKVVAADIAAKNGIIHAVRHILVPPPPLGPILALDPSRFSTLLLAYQKTDFVKYVHGLKINGSTLFAPDNEAFAALGPRANAFLFNTEKGLKYLDALLKYQIAPNATLYTDAFYDKTGKEEKTETREEHYDLATLLPGANIGVDIKTIFGFKIYLINGFTKAKIEDVVGKNGVIQVVNKVPIPPRNKHETEDAGGEIELEDLMERLAGYVE